MGSPLSVVRGNDPDHEGLDQIQVFKNPCQDQEEGALRAQPHSEPERSPDQTSATRAVHALTALL